VRECFDRMDGKVTQGVMQLVKCVATSRSPGCGQRIDDLEMLRRYFRRSSSSSSGVSSPSLSAPLIAQWFRLWLLFHSLFSPQRAARQLGDVRPPCSSRVRLIARQSGTTRRLCRQSGEKRKCAACV